MGDRTIRLQIIRPNWPSEGWVRVVYFRFFPFLFFERIVPGRIVLPPYLAPSVIVNGAYQLGRSNRQIDF